MNSGMSCRTIRFIASLDADVPDGYSPQQFLQYDIAGFPPKQ
jgi:hypothetical protein